MAKANGRVLYRGPSRITGAPVVVVAILESSNVKTGNMLQTYILSDEGMGPLQASQAGADVSVCGMCPQRRFLGGACYVDIGKGPTMVYKTLAAGKYPDISSDPAAIAALGAGRKVRIGSYGDPAAVPADLWTLLLSQSTGHTGYTHQWQAPIASDLRGIVMASVDSADEAAAAKAQGWRYFRVRGAAEDLHSGEFACPASEEGGKRRDCSSCLACHGATPGKSGASVAIIVHGSLSKRFTASRATA